MGKKLLISLAGLLVVGLIGIGLLLANINPLLEKFKPQISKAISSTIKAPVELGELKANLFPSVTIEARDVTLKGAAGEGNSVKSLLLSTSLLGLLKGQATVDELKIKGATFSIIREADGSLNIGGLNLSGEHAGEASPEEQSQTPPHEPQDGNKKEPSISFAITDAAIENLSLSITDRSVSPVQTIEVKDFSANVKNISDKDFGSVKLEASLLGTSPKNIHIDGKASLAKTPGGLPKADLVVDLGSLDLARIVSLLGAYGISLSDAKLSDSASIRSEIHIGDDGLKIIPSLEAKNAGIVFANLFSKPSGLQFSIVAEVKPTLLGPIEVTRLDTKLGTSEISSPLSLDANGKLQSTLKAPEIHLSELSSFFPLAEPYKLSGSLSADLQTSLPKDSAPQASGKLELKEVAANIPVGKTEDGKSLSIKNLNGAVELANDSAKITSFSALIADQPLQLKASITSFANPIVAFVVSSENLSLLSVLQQIGNPALNDKGPSEFSGLKISGSVASSPLKGDVSIAFASAQLTGAALGGSKLDIGIANNLAALKPSTLSAFGGEIKAEGSYSLGEGNNFSSSIDARNLQLDQISKLSPSSIKVTGTLSQSEINLRGVLANIPQSLNGTVKAQAVDGSIAGFNILGQTLGKVGSIPLLGAALTNLIPQQYQPLITGDSTMFQTIKTNISLGDNAATIQELSLTHPVYTLSGSGTYGFGGEANIKAQLKLTPLLTEAMALKEPKLKLLTDPDGSLVIPVVIHLKDGIPLVVPDITDLGKRAAANTAKEAVGRALDKVAPGLGGASKLLDGLLK